MWIFKSNIVKKAFTLIELLIVVAIIGILASVVLVSSSNARIKAKEANYRSFVKQTYTLSLALVLTDAMPFSRGVGFGDSTFDYACIGDYTWNSGLCWKDSMYSQNNDLVNNAVKNMTARTTLPTGMMSPYNDAPNGRGVLLQIKHDNGVVFFYWVGKNFADCQTFGIQEIYGHDTVDGIEICWSRIR